MNTLGKPETGAELYIAFRLLSQRPGETLSEFLRRMERPLNKAVQKGGLPLALANRSCLELLIKGATGLDMILINLRIRERKDSSPTFLQLLNEICTEEEYENSRQNLNPTRKSVHVKALVSNAETEMSDLKAQIQELKSQVKELTAQSSQPSAQSAPVPEPTPTVSINTEPLRK